MDKTLPDKNPMEIRAADKGAYNPNISEKKWVENDKAWKDSPTGRLAIRLFSRGIMGAAFFTAGGLLNRRWMHTAEETLHESDLLWEGKYDATKPFSDQKNPLQFIAKGIDTFVGKPIEFIVKAVTSNETWAKNSIRFRQTKVKDMENSLYEAAKAAGTALPKVYRGRSLGNETVAVTFDFFCASIGDALGRDIADLFDSSVEKKWIKNGHVDFKQAAKSAAKSTWRYVTYNGGEDWAVAIPYVYFMKGQRSLINHFSPGFMYDFDRNLNGGSFKIDEHKNITGNFNMEGALDLQSRFVAYNMGTLMYRELYDYTARKLQGKNAVLYGAPDKDTSHQTAGEKIGNVFKWMARSVVKAGIYMSPSVPFFWITRTPQTKFRGAFINPNGRIIDGVHTGPEMLSYENPNIMQKVGTIKNGKETYRKYEVLHANDLPKAEFDEAGKMLPRRNKDTGLTPETGLWWSSYKPDPDKKPNEQFHYVEGESFSGAEHNPIARDLPVFDAFAKDHVKNIADGGFNAIGRANHRLAKGLNNAAGEVDEWAKRYPRMGGALRKMLSLRGARPETPTHEAKDPEHFNRFTQPFAYASLSYTPYMYAKAEFAKLWDTGKMDLALERMIDGAAGLKWGEFKAGVSETTNAILHYPFTDPAREKEAERRTKLDTSDAAGVNRTANGNGKPSSNWRDRLIQGKPEDALELAANRNLSHADKEELRKILEKSTPPVNSIN